MLRLLAVVEGRNLHPLWQAPLAWLHEWMDTPRPDLNGRCPSSFTSEEDWDLILVGLLLREPAALRASAKVLRFHRDPLARRSAT